MKIRLEEGLAHFNFLGQARDAEGKPLIPYFHRVREMLVRPCTTDTLMLKGHHAYDPMDTCQESRFFLVSSGGRCIAEVEQKIDVPGFKPAEGRSVGETLLRLGGARNGVAFLIDIQSLRQNKTPERHHDPSQSWLSVTVHSNPLPHLETYLEVTRH